MLSLLVLAALASNLRSESMEITENVVDTDTILDTPVGIMRATTMTANVADSYNTKCWLNVYPYEDSTDHYLEEGAQVCQCGKIPFDLHMYIVNKHDSNGDVIL